MSMTPNQTVMREWVDALRSGQYPQTAQRLRTDNGFCCLGVLCELAVQKGVIQPGARSGSVMPNPEASLGAPIRVRVGEYVYDGSIVQPSPRVLAWAGVPIVNKPGTFAAPLTGAKLAELNDDGVPFSAIADLIEKHWIESEPEPEVEVTVPDDASELAGELVSV